MGIEITVNGRVKVCEVCGVAVQELKGSPSGPQWCDNHEYANPKSQTMGEALAERLRAREGRGARS